MNSSFTMTPKSISIFHDGQPYIVPLEHPNFEKVKDALRTKDYDLAVSLCDLPKAVATYTDGEVEIRGNAIYYNDEPIHNYVVDRIFDFMDEGLDHKPLIAFLKKLMKNPSGHSVRQLYSFLEHKNLPVTDDGDFLAYKAVRKDFRDKHSGKIDNSIGNIVEVPRNKVDDDYSRDCSYGLHAGSIEYVRGFHWGDDVILVVKINPADVVAVPEHDSRKLRTCKYEVISVLDRDKLPDNYVDMNEIKDDYYNDYEDDEDDEDDYYNDYEDDLYENDGNYCENDGNYNEAVVATVTINPEWCDNESADDDQVVIDGEPEPDTTEDEFEAKLRNLLADYKKKKSA